MANYYPHIHLNTSITTVNEFLKSPLSLVKSLSKEPDKFLNFKDSETGTTNADSIWSMYTEKVDLDKYPTVASIDKDAPLKQGTALFIPKENLNNEMVAINGKNLFQKTTKFETFVDENFQKIVEDESYIRENVVSSKSNTSDVNIIEASAQVWIYVRALGEIIDVTNFLTSLSTTKDISGSFSISLSTVTDFENIQINNSGDYIDFFSIENEDLFRNSWFHENLQQNDIVFIRFEKLLIEKDRNTTNNSLKVPSDRLKGAIWDMIGLVDSNSQNYSSLSNDLTLNINGRDFTKLLTEDGSYFFPYVLVEGSENFFITPQSDNNLTRRLFVSSKLNTLFAYTQRTIKDTLGFVFNQLTNVGILPPENKLFAAYGNDRAKTYQIQGANNEYLNEVEQNGVWQIVKLLVDEQLDDVSVADSGISSPDGSLMDMISKICQNPFVEFYGDTFGSFFNFIARQKPFTKSQILDSIRKNVVEVDAKWISNYSVQWEEEYYSIFQLVPQDSFLGNSNFIALAHIPVIYFPEYINNFGNHKLSISLNYLSYKAFYGDNKGANADLFKQSLVSYFKYLIESHFYLPFTRKGSFEIDGGDRRIKRGTWIKLNFTNEYVYVDGVSHSLSASNSDISRTTTVNFSRAMKANHLTFTPVNGFNYFDVVNTDVISELLNSGLTGKGISKNKSKLIVNEKAFDYFLKRKQMKSVSGLVVSERDNRNNFYTPF